MIALANIARGTLRDQRTVSPTWQAAASNAGAAKPIRYRPAIALVTAPHVPGNGCERWKVVARCQLSPPSGATAEMTASPADAVAIGTAMRVTQRTPPKRLTAVKPSTISAARNFTGIHGRYHWWSADAESR